MNLKQRIQTVPLILLLAGFSLWQAFVQPFQPGAVRKAIPAKATSTYRADTLTELLTSPVVLQLNQALPFDQSLQRLLQENKNMHSWMRKLAPSEIVVASIPSAYSESGKSWAAVSWVGWRSPWIRWQLQACRSGELTQIGHHSVWPVWQWKRTDIPDSPPILFALTDNLMVASLSNNAEDLVLLLDTYDKRVRSIESI